MTEIITNEAGLETMILSNNKKFMELLGEDVLNIDPQKIKFIGNQVVVGQSNRFDLLYSYDTYEDTLLKTEKTAHYIRHLVIVELKFRELRTEDLAQVGRYINAIYGCDAEYPNEKVFAYEPIGILIGIGMDRNVEFINGAGMLNKKKIILMNISSVINFDKWEEESVDTDVLTIDKRLKEELFRNPTNDNNEKGVKE